MRAQDKKWLINHLGITVLYNTNIELDSETFWTKKSKGKGDKKTIVYWSQCLIRVESGDYKNQSQTPITQFIIHRWFCFSMNDPSDSSFWMGKKNRTKQDKRRVDWRTVRDRRIVRKQRLIDEWQSDIWIKLLFVIISTYTRTTHNYHHVGCKELLSAGAEDSACAGNAEILADARVVPAIDQAAIVAREKDKIVGGVWARETEIG